MTNEPIDFCTLAFVSTYGYTLIWKAVVTLMPPGSLALFVHGWILRRHNKQVSWHSRMIILAALITLTATLIRVTATIRYVTGHFKTSHLWALRIQPLGPYGG